MPTRVLARQKESRSLTQRRRDSREMKRSRSMRDSYLTDLVKGRNPIFFSPFSASLRLCVSLFAFATLAPCATALAQEPAAVDADILLHGGQVLDGTGSPA